MRLTTYYKMYTTHYVNQPLSTILRLFSMQHFEIYQILTCLKPKAQSPKPKAQSPKPKAQSPKPKAQSPKVQSPKPKG